MYITDNTVDQMVKWNSLLGVNFITHWIDHMRVRTKSHDFTIKQLRHGSFLYYRIYSYLLLVLSLKIAHETEGWVRYF